MHVAQLPVDEPERLEELESYGILDTAPTPVFDDIARLAAQICETPMALVSLVDEDRQWFKAHVGVTSRQIHRDLSLCAHAILSPDDAMVVPDMREDLRFVRHPLVQRDQGLRFYAGVPIRSPSGRGLGTVCVLDWIPRRLGAAQIDSLRLLAQQAEHLLEAHRSQEAVSKDLLDELLARTARDEAPELQADGPGLVYLLDRGYVYRYVSPQIADFCDATPAQIEGRHVADLVGPEAFETRVRPLLDSALEGTPVSHEASFEFSRRGRCLMRIDYQPVQADGRVLGVLVRVQDVRTQAASRERLREAIAALD